MQGNIYVSFIDKLRSLTDKRRQTSGENLPLKVKFYKESDGWRRNNPLDIICKVLHFHEKGLFGIDFVIPQHIRS